MDGALSPAAFDIHGHEDYDASKSFDWLGITLSTLATHPTMDKADPSSRMENADPELARTAAQAIVSAARRLGRDPLELAGRLGDGLIADLIEELDLARRLVPYPTDADRIARLIEGLEASRDGTGGTPPNG